MLRVIGFWVCVDGLARFEVSVGGPVTNRDDVRRWEDAGVDRLIVSPWARSREAVEGLERFAGLVYG